MANPSTKGQSVYLCLSSGYSEQYRRDIIRALAMPAGIVLQFRYQDKYIQEEVRRELPSLRGRRPRALIAYVDQSDPESGKDPEMVPVRYATLLGGESYGRFHTLQLELGALCATETVEAFNRSVRANAPGVPPVWKERTTVGSYCFKVNPPAGTVETNNLIAFEDTVKLLTSHKKDFGQESLYYHVLGIESLSEAVTAVSRRSEFVLKANANYQIRVLHFHPDPPSETRLTFQSGTSHVIITTNPTLYFRSRYDLKTVGLRVVNPPPAHGELPTFDEESERGTAQTGSVLSVFRLPKGAKADDKEWEFDIPIRIRPDLAPVRAFGSLLGFALSVPSLVTIAGSSALSITAKWSFGALAVIASVTLGMLAALGLRRAPTS